MTATRTTYAIVLGAVVVLLVFAGAWWHAADACSARGGVLVEGMGWFVCVTKR